MQNSTISLGFGWGTDGTPGITLAIPDMFLTGHGDKPVPGVVMSPAMAREYGLALMLMAEQLSNGSVVLPPLNADYLQSPPS